MFVCVRARAGVCVCVCVCVGGVRGVAKLPMEMKGFAGMGRDVRLAAAAMDTANRHSHSSQHSCLMVMMVVMSC